MTIKMPGKGVMLMAAAVLLATGISHAATVVDIQPGGWGAAMGNITPSPQWPSPPPTGSGLTWAAEQFYNGDNPVPVAATLTPDVSVSDGTTTESALVMSWDLPQGSPVPLAVAWWDYDFGPGQTTVNLGSGSTRIRFSLLPPIGVWDFSVELIDITGKSRGWFQANPQTGSWGTFEFSPNGGLQNPFGFYASEDGFDITNVAFIRFDEAGMWSNPITFPPNPSGVSLPAWNAWDTLLIVTPEPATLLLMGAGLLGLGWTGRRRNHG